jgi:hypothetical protein
MLRTTALIIGVVAGGPALAFLVLFAGCDGPSPVFGTACGHNILVSLVGFTLLAWLVLGVCATLFNIVKNKE